MSQFAVVQTEYRRIDPFVLAPHLMRHLGLVRYDALHRARQGCGIVAERATRDEAEALGAALEAEGFPARVIPQEQVVSIGRPRRVRIVVPAAAGLGVVWGFGGDPEWIVWERIVLISAGEVSRVREARAPRERRRGPGLFAIAAGLIGGLQLGVLVHKLRQDAFSRGGPSDVLQLTERQPMADAFARGPSGEYLHIRLCSQDLYYEQILGEDYLPDYFANFRLVLARIGMRAARALVSPETQALLTAANVKELESAGACFAEEAEFTQYNRWLLQAAMLEGGDRPDG